MKAVEGIARHLHATSFAVRQLGDVEDVAAYGAIGLLEAARKFDRRRRIKLSTFASARIRGAIFDAVRQTAGTIRTPRLALLRGEASLVVASLEGIHERHQNESGRFTGAQVAVTKEAPRDDSALAIERFLKTLTRKERSIVRLYWGLVGPGLTMAEVGRLHGLSESRVSQMHSDILKRAYKHRAIRELERR